MSKRGREVAAMEARVGALEKATAAEYKKTEAIERDLETLKLKLREWTK